MAGGNVSGAETHDFPTLSKGKQSSVAVSDLI